MTNTDELWENRGAIFSAHIISQPRVDEFKAAQIGLLEATAGVKPVRPAAPITQSPAKVTKPRQGKRHRTSESAPADEPCTCSFIGVTEQFCAPCAAAFTSNGAIGIQGR
jgi:hypothetical protein